MGQGPTRPDWASLNTLLAGGTLGSLSDAELLDRFRREPGTIGQDAFRILVERHGSMVLGVCRSLIRDPHEAEDAFQATFLVLVRRADSIRRRETIAPWLYGVASRVARKARIRSARRREREVTVDADLPDRSDSGDRVTADDLALLHEEIRRLPEGLRAPLILCGLEGMGYELAAGRLGLRESTLRGRLHRARRRLEGRLRRRGLLHPMVAPAIEAKGFALSRPLVESTTRLASRWSALSGLLAGAESVPGPILTLVQGVTNAMRIHTIKVCALAAALTTGVAGTLVVAQQEKSPPQLPASGNPVESRPNGIAAPPSGDPSDQPRRLDLDRRSQEIRRRLDSRVELDLPEHPTLGQFLKEIKRATTVGDFPGIAIYVDPIGLQEAGTSIDTPVTVHRSGDLAFVLRQALRERHLWYLVKDGFLMISSRSDITDQRLDELDSKFDRLFKALERVEPRPSSPSTGSRQP